jgi:hypothetical protein
VPAIPADVCSAQTDPREPVGLRITAIYAIEETLQQR